MDKKKETTPVQFQMIPFSLTAFPFTKTKENKMNIQRAIYKGSRIIGNENIAKVSEA